MSDSALTLVLVWCAATGICAWLAVRQWLQSLPPVRERAPMQPSWFWRLLKPVASPLEPVIAVTVSGARLQAVSDRLARAGLDVQLDASRFLAGRVVLTFAAATAAAWLSIRLPGSVSGLAHDADSPGGSGGWMVLALLGSACLGWMLPGKWLREQRASRVRSVQKTLPFFLDVITLSVESGANLTVALQQAVAKGPTGPLRIELERVLVEVRTGRARSDALRALAWRVDLPAVSNWVAALVAAERQGSSLGPILRAQAEQRRQERFLAAEKLAMKAPVKMLFPLLVFIFPCTFVLLLFPVAVRLLQEGILK